MKEYSDFLATKRMKNHASGFDCEINNSMLFEYERDITRWALRKGKSAIFADCGLGKTAMQLQWAKEINERSNSPILILAPLAVAKQTQAEGEKFGIPVNICREQSDVINGINITNYEMLHHFSADKFTGIVLDESSILKHSGSKTREAITKAFKNTPYKLCCTATPAPNDFMELGNHAQFLGIMSQPEMLATFFLHDGGDTSKWRLKGHAESKFFEWVASWACCITNPNDLGYEQEGFNLPPLNIIEIPTKSEIVGSDGQIMLFAPTKQSLNERRLARKDSLQDRVAAAAEIANKTSEQVLIWCDLNDESARLTQAINGAIEVKGSDTSSHKEAAMLGFTRGEHRVLVSKPSIAGWGMNWQQCHNEIFVGLSDSFEAYYQAVRRCWRFGQKEPVNVYIVISEAEGAVRENINRKQQDAQRMTAEIVKHTSSYLKSDLQKTTRIEEKYYANEIMELPLWLEAK